MERLIRDILNEIQDAPRRSAWTSGVCSYAVDILSRYIHCRGFNIWDEAAQIGKITEEDLLNGAQGWRQYSRDGHSLIYDKDICHRCYGWENWGQFQDGKLPPNDHEDWLDFQARFLQQAAQIVINAVNGRGKGENMDKEIQGKEMKGYCYADGIHWHWGDQKIAVIDQETSEIEWCVRKYSLPDEVIQAVRNRRPKAAGKWTIEVKRIHQSTTQGSLLVQINGETVMTFGDDKILGENGWESKIPNEELGRLVYSTFWHPMDQIYHYSDKARKFFAGAAKERENKPQFWRYTSCGGSGGLVIADTKEEAARKLAEKYGSLKASQAQIWSWNCDDYYDEEHPNILNIYDC